MTSLHQQASGLHYARPYAAPPASACRSIEPSESMCTAPCCSHAQSAACSLNSNAAGSEWNAAPHQPAPYRASSSKHAAGSLPLHTDPEMYALRNIYSSSESKAYASTQQHMYHHHHQHLPGTQQHHAPALMAAATAVAVAPSSSWSSSDGRQVSSPGNNRFAYVEALVDTNAHVIESIWAGTSSNWSRSAVVPLRTFIQEVLKRSRTTYSTLQTALFYLFQAREAILKQLYGGRGSDERSSNARPPQWHDAYISCGRRMFLASLVVASKFVQDKTYRNSAWAKIAGLPVAEINAAERIFLDLIDYNLYIAQPTFERWHHLLHLHVDARAHNQPAYLHDLSCLHASLAAPNQHQAPSAAAAALPPTPTSPSTSFTRLWADQQRSAAAAGRKRRFRGDTPAARYTSYSSPSTTCSPASPASHIPPVLSLSLPSSNNSSPMHTPTQVSPVRNLAFSWKMSPATEPAASGTKTACKKRRLTEDPEYTTHGYAVSHVRGMRIKQQQQQRSISRSEQLYQQV